jgi:hypothetical protein
MNRLDRFAAAFCFVGGVLMAGSDGPYFPWINCLGACVFALTIPFARRI